MVLTPIMCVLSAGQSSFRSGVKFKNQASLLLSFALGGREFALQTERFHVELSLVFRAVGTALHPWGTP